MLGAGLRREFPGASAWAGRVPRPRLARSGVGWAVLAGLGASALASALLGAVAGVVFSVVELPRDWHATSTVRSTVITLVATAAGAAVSLRSGGWRAAMGFAGALVVLSGVDAALTAPGRALFCERMGGGADLPLCAPRTALDEIVARWPAMLGVVGGLLGARLLEARERGTNAALEAIGIVAALEPATRAAATAFLGPLGEPAPIAYFIALSLFRAGTAAAGGHVLARRGPAGWRTAAVLSAAYFLAHWLHALVFYARYPMSVPPAEYLWLETAPVVHALAFILAAVVTAALARSRRPGAGGARRGPR